MFNESLNGGEIETAARCKLNLQENCSKLRVFLQLYNQEANTLEIFIRDYLIETPHLDKEENRSSLNMLNQVFLALEIEDEYLIKLKLYLNKQAKNYFSPKNFYDHDNHFNTTNSNNNNNKPKEFTLLKKKRKNSFSKDSGSKYTDKKLDVYLTKEKKQGSNINDDKTAFETNANKMNKLST